MATLTIDLDDELDAELARLAKEAKRSKSDLVHELIRREAALYALRQAQKALRPLAEQKGYLSDEDFFRDFS